MVVVLHIRNCGAEPVHENQWLTIGRLGIVARALPYVGMHNYHKHVNTEY